MENYHITKADKNWTLLKEGSIAAVVDRLNPQPRAVIPRVAAVRTA
jgi:hypothetical protein